LQIKEGGSPVMFDQFANDVDIAAAILEGNLNKDLLFHSALNAWKADRRDKIEDINFSC
jgi:hypothetical protein